jgi:hypothetical protein
VHASVVVRPGMGGASSYQWLKMAWMDGPFGQNE